MVIHEDSFVVYSLTSDFGHLLVWKWPLEDILFFLFLLVPLLGMITNCKFSLHPFHRVHVRWCVDKDKCLLWQSIEMMIISFTSAEKADWLQNQWCIFTVLRRDRLHVTVKGQLPPYCYSLGQQQPPQTNAARETNEYISRETVAADWNSTVEQQADLVILPVSPANPIHIITSWVAVVVVCNHLSPLCRCHWFCVCSSFAYQSIALYRAYIRWWSIAQQPARSTTGPHDHHDPARQAGTLMAAPNDVSPMADRYCFLPRRQISNRRRVSTA